MVSSLMVERRAAFATPLLQFTFKQSKYMNSAKKFLVLASTAFLFASCQKEKMMNEPGNLVPKTADQDRSISSINVNGAMLHSEAFGHPDSAMIVCVHGGPGNDYRYILNYKDLADHGYRVVFYDQRGSGLSQRFPSKFYTNMGTGAIDMFYDDLSGVIAHYRTSPSQKVFLLGHSWGAMLATGYVGKHPTAVQGLIVSEPGGLKWNDIKDYVQESSSFSIWKELFNDVTYLDQFISGKTDQHEILDYKHGLIAAKNDITGDNTPETGAFWRSGAVVSTAFFEIGKSHEPDFSSGISQFKTPVLFFYSSLNEAYPDSWAQKISSAYSSVSRHKISGVGHRGIVATRSAWTGQTMPKILNYLNSLNK
jgi:proline iminopeptidase